MSTPPSQATPSQHPYLTADLPGIGGVLKQRHEDFLVEEQPMYEPSGEGEHLYLFVEKQGMTTMEAVRQIARSFRVGKRDVGYAGLKDKHAITRQHFTVWMPGRDDDKERLANLAEHTRLKVLWAERHGNKLRRGHHGGNRFVIRVRGVEPMAVVRAKPILDRLVACGAPNYVGQQRFGFRNNTHEMGRLLILGQYQALLDEMLGRSVEHESEALKQARVLYREGKFAEAIEAWPRALRFDRQALDALRKGKSAEQVVRAIDATQRDFMVCAFQSAVFNDVLARRIAEGTFDKLLPGDLAFKHDNRAVFAVDEATAALENGEGGRVRTFGVSPSGPMWGPQMMRAAGEVDAMELVTLQLTGITLEQMEAAKHAQVPGSRRPMRVPIRDADLSGGVDEHGPYVRFAFELPRGSFATEVLDEVMKVGVIEEEEDR